VNADKRVLRWGSKVTIAAFFIIAASVHAESALAESLSVNHSVTVNVPKINQLIADRIQFSLDFQDNTSGSKTNTETVSYQVKANSVQRSDSVVQVKATSSLNGVQLNADPGNYSKEGGNATLVEASPGFIPIGEEWTPLFNKTVDTGDGEVLRGTFTVNYRADALQDLPEGQTQVELTVTLVDA